MDSWPTPIQGITDAALFLLGAALLVALAKLWVPALRLRTAMAYVLLAFALFAAALTTSRSQVVLDYVYSVSPWADTLAERTQPQNTLLGDVSFQMLPFRHLAREHLLQGTVPLWSHELGTGQPLLGNAQSAPFAPLHLMALPLPALRAMTVSAAWQVLVALLGTHLLLLELGARRHGAMLGALAFALSTCSFAWLYYPIGMASSWIPAVMLGLLHVLRERPRAWVGLGLAATALVLSGYPSTVGHTVVVAGLVLLAGSTFGSVDSRLSVLRQSALAAILVVACTAPVVLPALEALPHGERAVSVERAEQQPSAVTPAAHDTVDSRRNCEVLTLFHPFACGSQRDGNWSEPSNFNAVAAYPGWIVLAAGIAAGLLLPGVQRFSLFLGLAILTFALNPSWFPGTGLGSITAGMNHGRARAFWVLAIAVSAGLGLEKLLARRVGRWVFGGLVLCGAVLAHVLAPEAETPWQAAWRWSASLGLLATLVPLAVSRWRRWLPWLALPLLAVELSLAVARHNPLSPPGLDLGPPEVVRFLQEKAAAPPPFRVTALGPRFLPYLPAVYGLWDPRGYDPMRPGEAARIVWQRTGGHAGSYLQGKTIDTPFLSFLGVRYLLAGRETLPSPWRPVYEGVGGVVWENPTALDLLFVPREVVPATGRKEALQHAATSTELADRAMAEGIATARRRQRGKARLLATGSNRLRLELSGPPGTIFASSVTWMPGWRGDPSAVRLVRVNGGFLGLVKEAPGELVTELRYSPNGWRAGLAISVVLAGLLGLWILVRQRPLRQ